jgi:hypothetical protein
VASASADERTDALLVRRVGSEKHSQGDGFTPWEAGDIMRREWAWRWMVPMPAQRNRDCAAESLGTAARLHRDNSVWTKASRTTETDLTVRRSSLPARRPSRVLGRLRHGHGCIPISSSVIPTTTLTTIVT